MMLAWHWPWAALAGVLATLAIIVLIVAVSYTHLTLPTNREV